MAEVAGKSLRPLYNFKQAERVLSLDSNFLHGASGQLQYARDFSEKRKVDGPQDAEKMNRLYMAESTFSTTGGMADHRLRVASSHMPAFACLIAAEVLEQTGGDAGLVVSLRAKASGP